MTMALSVIVITNQSGVVRGYFTEETLNTPSSLATFKYV
ncbi:MAG: hypothetical protein DDT30_01731 [Dehalococcoidia bacterium]|nr:hypothetical protein [Bacillota bacterium]MBT9143496.1 hypothetical protein [Bacillota bacterium]